MTVDFSPNTIHCGDNLEILKSIPDGVVDLCYIDPPFYSKRNHKDVSKKTSEVRGFQDTWSGDKQNYLDFMKPRVEEIFRVLKPNGSFYLHCDISAVFHLKVICDEVFGPEGFLNDIVWKRHSSSKNTSRNYASIADHILFYAKGSDYTFHMQYTPIDEKVFNLVEKETGRRFRSQPLVVSGETDKKEFNFGGRIYTLKEGKRLKWTQETIDKRLKKNPRLIYWTKSGDPRYKTYLDERKGIMLSAIWTDIKLITSTSSERLGYPTQKPIKLMRRILNASSNEGDVVLDVFCGSGTTLVAAKELKRNFIGIDASPTACRLTASRIGYPEGKIIGYPQTKEEFSRLPDFEFVNWVSGKMNSTQKAKLKKLGIEAVCKHSNVPIFIQNSEMDDSFDSTMLEKSIKNLDAEKHAVIVIVAHDFSGKVKNAIDEWKKETNLEIITYTIEDLANNKHFLDKVSVKETLF
ncbi:MAG: site-specific DNA-methyltransferase [Candidatus Hodarchaeota archaeon]